MIINLKPNETTKLNKEHTFKLRMIYATKINKKCVCTYYYSPSFFLTKSTLVTFSYVMTL